MSTQKNLITLCFAAVSTLGLAACGGGDASVMETTVIEPVVDTTLEEIAAEAAAVVAATKAAATKLTAIDAEAIPNLVAGLGGSGVMIGNELGNYELSIERDRTATTVTVTVHGATPDDDVEFMQVMDFGDGRTMHTRTMDADENGDVITEVVIVSTDIEEPKAVAFAMLNVDAPYLDANPETMGGMDFQSVSIDIDNIAMIATDGITAVGAGSITVPAAFPDDATTADVDETVAAFETDATFDGAPGTLKCTGTDDCTVRLDADGKITEFGTNWQFTPADGATSDVADADYLDYGFWLKRTTDADGATTYNEVETFANSSNDPSTGTQLSDVVGTASYEGGAVGVYVKNVFDSAGEIDTATSGHFNADASLTAYFGGRDITANQENTVTGTIDNFVLQHGEENAWSVALKGERGANANANTFSGSANGGGAEGEFLGTYRGPTPVTEDGGDDANARVAPGAVIGEFGANFSNGSVVGGFGASKQ